MKQKISPRYNGDEVGFKKSWIDTTYLCGVPFHKTRKFTLEQSLCQRNNKDLYILQGVRLEECVA